MTLYENAMVIPGTTAAQQNAAKLAFLQVPDMIQLGASWKFIELPHAIDPEKPIVAANDRHALDACSIERATSRRGTRRSELALKTLADYDTKNAPLLQTGDKAKIAPYHVGRIRFLHAIVKANLRTRMRSSATTSRPSTA